MIITNDKGRKQSIHTSTDSLKTLATAIANLTETEREFFESVVNKDGEKGLVECAEVILDHRYHTRPVSMEQFIEDPYYLGNSCETLWPTLKQDVIDLFAHPYREAVATGGIGVGKCVGGDTEIYDPVAGRRSTAMEMSERGGEIGCSTYDRLVGGMRAASGVAKDSGIKMTGDLRLQSGKSVRLSSDHPVLTPYGWRNASDLKKRDMVATARSLPPPVSPISVSDNEVKWVAYMLADGGTTSNSMTFTNECELGVLWIRSKYSLDRRSVDKRVPAEFYGLCDRQLGLFLNRIWACDGWICERSDGRSWEIGISLGSEAFVRDIQQLLLRFGIHSRVRKRRMKCTHNGEKRSSMAWSLSVLGAEEVARFLEAVGPVKGKEDKCDLALKSVDSVIYNSNFDITPVDRDVMTRIRSEIGPLPRDAYWPRPASGHMMGQRVFRVFSANYRLPEWCRWWGDVFWDRVESFDPTGAAERVYDLTVPGTANFAPYGVIVHNTFVGSIAICRILYELSCLADIQKTLGISSGTEIVITLVSKNLILAREVMKSAVDDKVKESPYFQENYVPIIKREYTLFPGNVRVSIGSYTAERMLGANVISAFLDECLAKNSCLTILNDGICSVMKVGEIASMEARDVSNLRILALDHETRELCYSGFEIRESTIQPLVRIETDDGAIEPSLEHPVLVRRGEWLVYEFARDIAPGDEIVWRIENATKGTEAERGSKTEIIGEGEAENGGEKPILRENSLGGDKAKAAGCESWEGERSSLGGDKAEDERIAEGSQVYEGAPKEPEQCQKREGEVDGGKEGGVFGDDAPGDSVWGAGSPSRVEGRGQSAFREKVVKGAKTSLQRDSKRARGIEWWASPHGRVAGEDFGWEHAGDQGWRPDLSGDGGISMWRDGSMQDRLRGETGEASVFIGGGGIGGRGGQDGLCRVQDRRADSNDCRGFQSGDGRRVCRDSGGEGRSACLQEEGDAANACDVELLQEKRIQNDHFVQSATAPKSEDGPICNGGIHVWGIQGDNENAPHGELEFAGVRKERIRVVDLPPGLRLSVVRSLTPLPPEQTYAIDTERNTFIADGFVVHNTNFPPKTRKQQITTGFGKKRSAAHFDIVEKVYRGLLRRIQSRFQKAGGTFPGMVILASSAATVDSFTERKIRESKDSPSIFVRDHTPWTARPLENFSGEWFYVLCSKSSMKSRILEHGEYDQIDEILADGDSWVIEIPEEFRDDFETDLENALRDIAGVSTQAISAFLQRPEMLSVCTDNRTHPFDSYEWIAGGPGAFQWEKICRKFERTLPGGHKEEGWVPIKNPTALRWCHVDTSVSGDASGICVGHVDRWVEVVRRDGDMQRYTEIAPFYTIDFMMRIVPPPSEQIYMPDIRRLIYELMTHGFQFAGFSSDTYQYVEMHQQIRRRGITTHIISMDNTTAPYDELKSAIYERRISFYEYTPFIDEMKALEYDRLVGRIDHPQAGCFVGDTMVMLWGGDSARISDLNGKEAMVVSYSKNGTVVPGKAKGSFTRESSELVSVSVAGHEAVLCTPEHRWMLDDGSYCSAIDLVPGKSRVMSAGGAALVVDVGLMFGSCAVPVYDLAVDEYSNFALECGAFVHNSKDVSDAVAGVVRGLSEHSDHMPIDISRAERTDPDRSNEWVSNLVPASSVDVDEIRRITDSDTEDDDDGEGFYPILGGE